MTSILQSLSKTVHLSLGIALLLFLGLHFFGDGFSFDRYFFSWLFRYLHVLTGIMWIGLLWYFNFVQIPSMPNIPDEQKPAIGKVIAPAALFYFRWAALVTWLSGAAILGGNFIDAFTFQMGYELIGIGAWLGTIMLLNVWGIIWPNQKKVLGIKDATDEEKNVAKRKAFLASRTNTLLSLPMLLSMVAAQNLY